MWARPQLGLLDPAVRKSLLRMAPLLLGTGVYQINILLSRLLASLLPTGSQSFLYYGQRLVEIPQGMLALAVASAALPSLARLSQRGEHEQAKAALRHSLRAVAVLRAAGVGGAGRARAADGDRAVRTRRTSTPSPRPRPRARWCGWPPGCGRWPRCRA